MEMTQNKTGNYSGSKKKKKKGSFNLQLQFIWKLSHAIFSIRLQYDAFLF